MTDTASPGTAPDPHAGLILERMTLEPAGKQRARNGRQAQLH